VDILATNDYVINVMCDLSILNVTQRLVYEK